MNTKLTFLIFALLFSTSIFAQQMDSNKLNEYLQALEENDKFMGSLTLSKDGKAIYSKAIGYADIESKTKASTKTKYRVGSISKMFTSVLTFKAEEEGKLKMSQTIDKYFPKVKNASKITIAHLLNHRSGVHSITSNEDYLSWSTQKHTKAQLMAKIIEGGSVFTPDSKAEYSNSNYLLLTFILEEAYGKSYAKLVKKKITKPAKLKDTYVGKKTKVKKREANSYRFISEWKKEDETHMSVPLGAGAIVSTPNDLTRFITLLFEGKFINKASLAQMTTLQDDYGMGIFEYNLGDKKAYGHGGGIDGFTSMLLYLPKDGLSVALTSNGSSYENQSIIMAAIKTYYGEDYDIPSFTTLDLTDADLKVYLGTYASADIPLKIMVTSKDGTLMAQATGQMAFPLEATEKHVFRFDAAGIKLTFNPDKNEMVLNQGGGKYTFTKE